MSQLGAAQPLRFRSVFISDVHLGFRGCSADFLLDFLGSMQTENLYLVGDLIDLWSLQKSFFWPQRHNDVLRALLNIAGASRFSSDDTIRRYADDVWGLRPVAVDTSLLAREG